MKEKKVIRWRSKVMQTTMKKNIHFEIESKCYSEKSFHDETFNSDVGSWDVRVGLIGNYITFLMLFNPVQAQTLKNLKDLKVNVEFINTGNRFTFKTPALARGTSSIYYEVFASASSFSPSNHYGYNSNKTFETKIEIDASSLTNSSPESSLVHFTEKMMTEEKLADVKIKTDDRKEFKACKFILTRSPVLDAMLNNHNTKEAQAGIIEIKGIKHEVMKEMVHYMYTDQAPKLSKMALELLVAADRYNLPGLMDKCSSFLQKNININNFVKILLTSDSISYVSELKDLVIDFITKNHEEAFACQDWKDLRDFSLKHPQDEEQNEPQCKRAKLKCEHQNDLKEIQRKYNLYAEVMERCFSALQKKP